MLFQLNRSEKRIVQFVTDALLITGCFVLAMALRLDGFSFTTDLYTWSVLVIVIPITLMTFFELGFYRAIIRYISSKILKLIIIGVGISAISMFIGSQLAGLPIPRSVPFIYAVLMILSVAGARFAVKNLYFARQSDRAKPVAIYGAGEAGRQLLNALNQSREYRPVAFIDDDLKLEGTDIGGLRVEQLSHAAALFDIHNVRTVLLALPSASRAVRKNIIAQLEYYPVRVKTMPGMTDLIEGKAEINELRNVSIEELLERAPVPPDPTLLERNIQNKVVLVSGAGGSIGSELCRQILNSRPRQLIILDVSEYALHRIEIELKACIERKRLEVGLIPIVCSVQNREHIGTILKSFRVNTLYHAAAYKHVLLVELNVVEGLRNNIFGTQTIAECAISAGVEAFILVSTDKAVRPTNFMGASKRMAELICQALAKTQSTTIFSIVRFGNVLGSSGSVIPLFHAQIESGGPITVTHKEITRYFMTIPEAAQLVIQAGSLAKGGDVFLLDMGEPIKIIDLAAKMARLQGMTPYLEDDGAKPAGDIEIKITGLRPGEKLFEELLIGEHSASTEHSRIMTADELSLEYTALNQILEAVSAACKDYDIPKIRSLLASAPTGFVSTGEINDVVWKSHLNS